ncbi:tenascin-R [Lingula anatina]|uniref:Tenascin-R n=1 Tax=Lingula anatina TaxID=7574 RepID=A0A1S3ISR4_LINAN|nr:tenascin-R [Lingula anatina]|eukprot:XP_013400569.1 tenascin-R [Lingula anatina]
MRNGTIGDSFVGARNMKFCTKDRDCNKMAAKHHGSWWFSKDTEANLNGNGKRKGTYHANYADGIYWKTFKGVWYSLESTRMAIRPVAVPSSTTSTTKSTTTSTTKSTTTSTTTKTTTKSTTPSTTTRTTTKSTPSTTTHKTSTTTQKIPTDRACTLRDADGNNNVYYIYPGTKCQKFAEYAEKERYGRVLECPPDTVFNVRNCQCDHPAATICPASEPPLDCSDLLTYGLKVDGIYEFSVGNDVLTASCLQTKMGGGWLIIQNRELTHNQPPPLNFSGYGWGDYARGFGRVGYEFWWGLEKMNLLTSLNRYDLHLILHDYDSNTASAQYTGFSVGNSNNGYKLNIGKFMGGDAGDSLSSSEGVKFYTPDKDSSNSDAAKRHGGWWFNKDNITANLNGNLARRGRYNTTIADGIFWKSWHGQWYSLSATTMMIKPSVMSKFEH